MSMYFVYNSNFFEFYSVRSFHATQRIWSLLWCSHFMAGRRVLAQRRFQDNSY